MDKSLTYIVAKNAGIATPAFWVINKDDRPVAATFTYPVFVKPARSGSSFGVKKVNSADRWTTQLNRQDNMTAKS